MTPRVERVLANFFYSFGDEACRNVRARVRHYEPWRRDALGNEDTIGGDAMAQEIAGQLRIPGGSISASAALAAKHPGIAQRAFAAAGVSAVNIDRIGRAVRGLRNATRGLNALGDVYDQMATLAAFEFSESQLVGRHEYNLGERATRDGFEDLQPFVAKVDPFFGTIKEFITLFAMSLESMPSSDINIFAIEAAFTTNDIPIPEDLQALFYAPIQAAPPPAATATPTTPAAPQGSFLEELNDTFWDGIGGLNDGRSPFN